MNRKIKNIIIIAIIIIVGVLSFFTMNSAKSSITSIPGGIKEQGEMGAPPDVPSNNFNGNNQSEPPAKPEGENNNNPSTQENMEKPEDDGNMKQGQPSGNGMMKPDINSQSPKITTSYYIIFGIEGLIVSILLIYLIMSNFNKKTMKETLNGAGKIILYIVLAVVLTAGLIFLQGYLTSNVFNNDNRTKNNNMQMPENTSTANIEYKAVVEVNGNETLSSLYTSEESDQNAILVKDGGNLTLDGATVSKASGDSSNTENSEFYGVNAGILVTENSTATIKDSTISTDAKGANAVFSTGENSKIYISDSIINSASESSARGLDSTYGGYIEADNVTVTTQGGSCATLATDRGEGTVIAKNSKLETNGTGSPVIYSTGDISIENTIGVANSSQMVVIEGKNTATVKNSTLSATGTGNRGDVDICGIMIYQSMSGDAGEGTGTFNSTDSILTVLSSSNYYKTAPMFFITNTDAIINLENTKLVYGSNILLSAKGTTEWGNSGSNGGNIIFNATNQELNGNIELDNISELNMNLTKSSYEGTINADNSAKNITLKLDASSKIKLTGDSYVNELEDNDSSYSNINFNGYKLYVNGTAIN